MDSPRASPERILSRFRWWFVATLVVLFIFVEFGRYQLLPYLDSWGGRLLMDLVILAGAIFFFGIVFDALSNMQRRLERQNRELVTLHEGVLDIHGQITLDDVLQRTVERAVQLLNARDGYLVFIDEVGHIRRIATTGRMTVEDVEGRLSASSMEPSPWNPGPAEAHNETTGAPSFVSVPVEIKGPCEGDLYVTGKKMDRGFTAGDEGRLARFATAVAIAIDNARLQDQLRSLAVSKERVRIGGELHDGMAQILAYVNTKAQAVRGHLERDRAEEARSQLEQLATAARTAYTDAREAILALRTELGPKYPLEDALSDFLGSWEQQSGIRVELTIEGRSHLEPMAELQLLRIVQEALANARKHSGAAMVKVGMRRVASRLQLTVADDGVGFDPYALQRSEFPRFGLAIMRERAESVGGSVTVYSRPGAGTRVIIYVPLEA